MSQSMTKAFVWAAGLGTRLRPYTNTTPKPLLPVFGKPLVAYLLRYLGHAGLIDVTMNTWHLGDQFEPLPEEAARSGVELSLSRQPQRFEHAGDLAFARSFLEGLRPDERFAGFNGDTLFYIDPEILQDAASRLSEKAPTLVFVHDSGSNALRVSDGYVTGIGDLKYSRADGQESGWDDFGVKLFHASIRDLLPETPETMGYHGSTGLLGKMADRGLRALAVPVEAARIEIGTVEDYETHQENEPLRALSRRLENLAPARTTA